MRVHSENPRIYINAYEFLNDIAQKYSDKNALQWGVQKTYNVKSYQDMVDDVHSFVAQIEDRGLVGKHIALIGKSSYDWITAFLAVIYTGSVAVPLNDALPMEELKKSMAYADVEAVILGDVDAQVKSEIYREPEIIIAEMGELAVKGGMKEKGDYASVSADSLACIIFTTGTTDAQKGVMLSQQNIMSGAAQYIVKQFENYSNKFLAILPHYHVFFLITVMTVLYRGDELSFLINFKSATQTLDDLKPDIVCVVPQFLQMMEKRMKKRENENIKTDNKRKVFIVGGAFLSSETILFFQKNNMIVLQAYGMTETSAAIASNTEDDLNVKAVGKVMPYTELRIKDGEIQVKGKNVMLGYYKEPELTKEAFDEGWLCTGDLGYTDEDGYLYLTGRKKNLIILSDGENVNPEIWEEKIQSRCKAINEILVFEQEGKIMAKIFSESGKREEIEAEVNRFNTTIPYTQRIQNVFFSEEPLPRTMVGKLKRKD